MSYFTQESERLTYRKLTAEDIPKWVPFFENNDHLRFLGIDISKDKETLAKDWIFMQFDRYERQGFGHLAIERKSDQAFIGLGGIIPRELEGRVFYEIAYSLKKEYWRQGYGTELARHMRDYGNQYIDTDQFVSIIHEENIGSIRVAQNNGMKVSFSTQYLGMPVDVYSVKKQGNQG